MATKHAALTFCSVAAAALLWHTTRLVLSCTTYTLT